MKKTDLHSLKYHIHAEDRPLQINYHIHEEDRPLQTQLPHPCGRQTSTASNTTLMKKAVIRSLNYQTLEEDRSPKPRQPHQVSQALM